MKRSFSYKVGRAVAKVPAAAWGAGGVLLAAVLLLTSGRSPQHDQDLGAVKSTPALDTVLATCQVERAAKVARYQELMKSDPWQASTSIRLCADRLKDKELQAMVAAAERADLKKTVENSNAEAAVRLDALDRLLTLGDPAAPKLSKLREGLVRNIAYSQALQAKAERARKKSEGVRLGASMQDVVDSSWGKPERVNRSENAYGTREQWVYGNGNYLYFRNGVLDSIQTSN